MSEQSFSARHGYDPKQPKDVVLEDAPEWMRRRYITLLGEFTYVDEDKRYQNIHDRPLGIKALHREFCAVIREETDQDYFDSWYCDDQLKQHLLRCAWYSFYDFVELVGRWLLRSGEAYMGADPFSVERYVKGVNGILADELVGWRLDGNCKLVRSVSAELTGKVSQVGKELAGMYDPAAEHFRKARRYVMEFPLDPENAIKETISTLESIARTQAGGATFGDALKELHRRGTLPRMFVAVLEKFYAYACAEPAVRHGATVSSRVALRDAELAFHVGAALTSYIVDVFKPKTAQEEPASDVLDDDIPF